MNGKSGLTYRLAAQIHTFLLAIVGILSFVEGDIYITILAMGFMSVSTAVLSIKE